MRNISFALTTQQIRSRLKTVTRRMGWAKLKPGDVLMAVEKSQGLKRGEKITRLIKIKVVDVRREPLQRMLNDPAYGWAEVVKEGFTGMEPAAFVAMFCKSHKGCKPDSVVTRIEFGYVEIA